MSEQEQLAELEAIANAEESSEQSENSTGSAGGERVEPETMQEKLEMMGGAELAYQFLSITFGLMQQVRGDHWAVDDGVMKQAAKEYGAMIDKNVGSFKLPPWAGTAAITGLLIYRPVLGEIGLSRAKKAGKAGKEKESEQAATGESWAEMDEGASNDKPE